MPVAWTLTVSVYGPVTIEVGESVTLSVRTMNDGSAVAGEDYIEVIRTLTFSADTQTVTVDVTILDDVLVEGDQSFVLELSGSRVSSDANVANVTILDDDDGVLPPGPDPDSGPGPVEISFESLSYEVSEGAGIVTLVAVLSGALSSGESMRVNVITIDSTAVAGVDYVDTRLELEFTSTVSRLSFSVEITDDSIEEVVETFDVKLSGEGVSASKSVARVTIMDDDGVPPVVPVGIGFLPADYRVLESAGIVTLTVSVLLGSIEAGSTVEVTVRTIDGTAIAGEDYTGIESVLTFTSESTTQTVSVVINGDALVENSEVFTVLLATSNEDVILSASTASVTITDEAVLSVVGPDSDEVEESATGMNVATFTVSLPDGVTAVEDITLSWSVDCTTGVIGAASAADFADDVCTPDSATILSGATSTNFSITIVDDDRPEGTESFTVSIVTMTAGDFDVTFDDGADEFEASVSLLDNEFVTVSVTSSVSSVREGESFTFRLVLEGGVYEEELILPWRVDFGSDSASASASDFAPDQALSGMVTIPANSLTSAPVTLTVAVDTFVEGDEIFRVIVPIAGRPVSVDFVIESMDFPSDDVTIVDDDADRVLMISITTASVTVSEGSVAVFTVELTGGVTDDDLSVVWSVNCGGGSDVTAGDFVGDCPSGTVTIASGETSATFAVYTNDDSVVERLETFTVTLSTVSPNIGGLITISADSGMASVDIRDTDTGNVVVSFDRGFRSVSGGSAHTCGIREDGSVACWGSNDLGQTTLRTPDGTELADVRFRALSAKTSYTCGIVDGGDDDGKVRCWGSISSTSELPTELVNVRFRAVNAGGAHACGIRDGGDDDGKVACWGANTAGQIGLVTPVPDLTPLANVRFRALSLGEYYSCGIVDGDFIIGDEVIRDGEVECWGTDFAGQSSPPQGVRFRALSSGENQTCGIIDGGDRDGEVDCWGATGADAAGNPDPTPRLAGVRFREVGSGIVHTCGIIDGGIRDGEVECWGSNGNMRSTPPTGLRLLTLGSGRHHNCGVQEDGTVACWGLPDRGQTSPPSFAIPEGDEVSFRASFSGDVTADEDISVGWSVSCDSGVNAEDFVGDCPSGTVRIAAGSGFGRFTIETNDDIVLENAEEFTVSLIDALPSIDGRITISSTRSSVTATITDNDTIDIGFEDLRYDVREDVGSVTLTVSVLSGEIGEGVVVTVDVRSINGRAVAGADYTSVRESLTFSSEVISRTLSVSILEDGVVEGTEEFELRLSGESVSSAAATAEVSIRDIDDGVITVTAVTGTVSEGEAANFRLELTEGSTETGIVVEWSVSCEGDVIGEDFVGGCPSGTATIAAGQTSTIFTITTNSDSVVENDERFTVSITGIEDLITISDSMSTASVTIEDEAVLSVSVPDFVEESVSGMSVARFTVSLAGDVTAVSDITLSWSVTCATDVTGVASPADFADFGDDCPSGTATILAGETFAVFSFTALDDEMREGTEIFTVSIVTMTTGNFDVVFDDGADGFVREFVAELDLLDAQSVNIDVLLSNTSVSEGGSLTFNLLLDGTVSEELILPWAISFDSASALDFAAGQALSGTVEIPANMRTSALVTVDVASDDVVEGDEFFSVIVPVEGRPTSEEFEIQSVEVSSDRVTILDDPADIGVITVTAVTGTVSEGGDVSFRVELTGGVTAEEVVGVVWSVTCDADSDVTGEDFVGGCPAGTVDIVSGETSATFIVSTADDSVVERVETVTVTLSRLSPDVSSDIASRITISDTMGSASAEITDTDRGVVSVTVVTRTVSEGDEATFRVELADDVTVGEAIGVSWVVSCDADGSVTADDFAGSVCPSGVVTIASGGPFATFTVSTADDDEFESDEEFTVTLTDVSPDIEDRVTISDTMNMASATISNNDAGVGFESLLYRVSEAAVSVTLFVVLSGEITAGVNVEVTVMTMDGTAVAVEDYEGRDESLEITSGSRRVPVSVNIINDDLVEGDEYFVVTLSGDRVSVAASSARVTILDDDRIDVTVEADSETVSEGDEVRFTVNLSGDGGDVTVNEAVVVIWSVSCGGDITAGDFDGVCPSGTVTIDPGASSATFRVRTSDDNVVEGSEGFTVTLSSVSPDREGGITISESMSTASVTIEDGDRGVVSVTVGTSTIPEGGEVTFTVELGDDVIADEAIGVEWSVSCGDVGITAADFGGLPCQRDTVTIVSGETSATFTVRTNDDDMVEGNEVFTVTLSDVSPDIEDLITVSSTMSRASVTIMDNDEAPPVAIGFSPDEYIVDEDAGSITLTVSVLVGTIEVGDSVTLNVMTVDGSAVAGEDYTLPSRTLTFDSGGATTLTFDVPILRDDVLEGAETFTVELSSMSDVVISASRATVTITDADRGEITISPVSQSVDEGDTAMFAVNLSGGATANEAIFVSWSVSCGGDITASDFDGSPCQEDTVTIVSGETSATFTVRTRNDNVVEGVETFTVTLSNVSPELDGSIRVSDTMNSASVTIEDGDEAILSVSAPADVEESATGMNVARFTVSLPDGVTADADITVAWSVNCVTGVVSAVDFANGECPFGTETIAAGDTSAIFSFMTSDDNFREGTEIFTVSIVTMTAVDFDVTFDDGADEFEARVRLLDDEAVDVSVLLSSARVSEGVSVTFNLVLSDVISAEELSTALELPWRVDFGSASEFDFEAGQEFSGMVEIPVNSRTSAPVTLRVRTDALLEGDESFRVTVPIAGRPSAVEFVIQTVEFNSEDVTISDENRGEITISPVLQSVDEGDTAMFIVNLSGGATANEAIVVEWSVSCGGDITASDFGGVCPSGIETISPGASSVMFAISTIDDNLVEGTETFTVTLSNVSPELDGVITISESIRTASVTILDVDEAILSVSAPGVVYEAVDLMNSAEFVVTLTGGVTAVADITVSWSVGCVDDTPGDASAADFADFGDDCPLGSVTILAGATSGMFSFDIASDDIPEGTEIFTVSIVTMTAGNFNVVFKNGRDEFAVMLRDDDDVIVSVIPSASSVAEGSSVTFNLESNYPISEELRLPWRVDFGSDFVSASADDFVPGQVLSGMLTIPANSRTSAAVTLRVRTDGIVEGNEVFSVIVPIDGRPTLVDFMIQRDRFVSDDVTIDDADSGSGVISLEPVTSTVSEGRDVIFTVSLSDNATFNEPIDVAWSVSCGDVGITAADFVGGCPSDTVTIPSGVSSATFAVSTRDDNVVEGMETFTVTLSNVSPTLNGLIRVSDTMNSASVTIEDVDEAILSVSAPADVEESATGMSVATFTVSLTGGVTTVADITVAWSVGCVDGTPGDASAADFVDEVCPLGTVTIVAGQTSADFSFMTLDDSTREGTEIFTVSIVTMTAGNFDVVFENGLDEFEASVRLLDDEAVDVSVLLSSARVSEGGSVTFNLVLSDVISAEELSTALELPWEVEIIRDLSFASADDFAPAQALSGTVTIPANSRTSTLVTLRVRTDALLEGDESFRVTVPIAGRPSAVEFVIQTVEFNSEDVTIEDENRGEITISPVLQSVDEGDTAMFIVNLSGGATANEAIVVPWSVSCGDVGITAADFGGVCPSGIETISPGASSVMFAISTIDDNLVEGTETFTVTLSNVSPELDGIITISESIRTASVTILDVDEAILSVSAPGVVYEAVDLMNSAEFVVTLTGGVRAVADITVAWSVSCVDGTPGFASAADFADFGNDCPSGSVTIMSGATSGMFSFDIASDLMPEETERFTVSFTSTTEGNFDVVFENGRDEFEVMLRDDDDVIVNVIPSASSVAEGSSVTFNLELDYAISEELRLPWEVDFGSDLGSASADDFEDGQVLSGMLTIPANSRTSAAVTLRVRMDGIVEGNEVFSVIVPIDGRPTLVDFMIQRDEFVSDDVTIDDAESGSGVISLAPVTSTVSEGRDAIFTVSLSDDATFDRDIDVEWSVSCGDVGITAGDFVGGCPSGTVTIPSGVSSATFAVSTIDDDLVEGMETFTVTLSNVSPTLDGLIRVSDTMNSASVTIEDGDEAILSVSAPYSVEESATGMSVATFTVSLTGGVTTVADITVDWSVGCVDGTPGDASAADFADEVCPLGTVTIVAGQTSAVFSFMTLDDITREGTEIFTVSIVTMTAGDFDVVFENGLDEFETRVKLLDDEAVDVSVLLSSTRVSEGGFGYIQPSVE